jgi:putative transcriptional regulator
VVQINLATRNCTRIQKLFVLLFILVIPILPAVVNENAFLIAATSAWDAESQKIHAFSLKSTSGLKAKNMLAQGKFLVADRRLVDPNFRETVVLLIRYGPGGAMGLVINRPFQIKLSTVLPDIKELEQRNDTLHHGGPVAPSQILLLVKSLTPPEASMTVFDDVYLSSSQKVLKRLIKKPLEEEGFKIFAGYAGWAPKQLESELDRGHWHVLNADTETLFDKKSSEIWQELIDRVSVKWVRTNNARKYFYYIQFFALFSLSSFTFLL